MSSLLDKRHAEIIAKQEVLKQAQFKLKQEFIGIDNIIDEVIESLSSWYLFPDLCTHPPPIPQFW